VSTTSVYGNTTLDSTGQFIFTNTLNRSHVTGLYALSSLSALNYHLNALSQFNITTFIYSWSSTTLYSVLQGKQLSGTFSVGIRYLVLDSPYLEKAVDIFSAIFYIPNYTTKSFSSASA
jgi:hypothetical protein